MSLGPATPTTPREPVRQGLGAPGGGAASLQWAALTESGNAVAVLAGLTPERPGAELRNFPALIRDAEPWRRERAENGIADLAAIMQPGMAALLAVNARGADSRPAALALLNEFNQARDALLALLPPSGALGPRRTA